MALDQLPGWADHWSATSDYATDPTGWISSKGEEVWSQQAAILDSVIENRYTAVHSAHDLGKSFIASRIIAWWIDTHPPGTAFVVSTAPTAAQVSAIMWREVTKIHRKGGLDGKVNRAGYPQWYIDGELVGYGRKPADYEQSAFQGIHARYVLVVIDEACGVNRNLYDAVDALATNEHARVLAIGNPDDPASHFATVCQPESGWNVIHLDGLRSPNMTQERVVGPNPNVPKYPLLAALMEAEGVPFSTEPVSDELRELLVDERWIEERIERWCGVSKRSAEALPHEELLDRVRSAAAGSPLFTAKVRGLFPESASDGIIPYGWVQRAVERWHDIHDNPKTMALAPSLRAKAPGQFILGVDVARSGDDETCFAVRYGSYVPTLERMHITDTTEVADRAAAYLHEPGSLAVVDVIGIGSGVYDLLRRYKTQGTIVGTPMQFNAAARSGHRDKLGQFDFLNDRAAAWWNMRELLDPAFGSQIALPDDERMIEELVSPKWVHHVGGRIKVESKDDIKKRLGRSTDAADAIIAAFWIRSGNAVGEMVEYAQTSGKARGGAISWAGYDPFTDEDMSISAGHSRTLGLGGSPLGPFAHDDTDW